MFYPTLEQARQLAGGYSVVPVSMELMADMKTPIEILRNLKASSEHYFILESVTSKDNWSRYSFLGYKPIMTVQSTDGITAVIKNGRKWGRVGEPLELLRRTLADYKSPSVKGLPPFTGGFVGYFSYDFVKNSTAAPELHAKNTEHFDDLHLMLIDKVIAFDHLRQKIYLIVNVATDELEQNYAEAIAALKDMEHMVLESTPHTNKSNYCGEFTQLFSKERYCRAVETLQGHIREGDIFQAVLSNRFTAPFEGSLLETYRILRTTNPSPYMVYMHMDDIEIACSSPETLVTLRGGKLSSFPLAGTRPIGADENELLSDEKELAEHDMLVDLARNDLGKISEFGSVQVGQYRKIKHFSHVMHISSMVTADISDGCDALDAVMATLPAGTLSGAPKKKACELIDGLENVKRGPYGGAMGYIDFAGNADFCIGIRMAVRKNDKVFVQAGAGIVADSVPEKEYQETINKAQAVMDALGGAK